jgi:hypothetical protein
MEMIREAARGASDEECLCLNVIGSVEARLKDAGHEVVRRLKAELGRRLADGPLTLPERPPVSDSPSARAS